MEVNILKENKNELEFEIVGEDHTFSNALQNFLNNRKEVVLASYKIKHPLLSNPQIYVKIKDMKLPKGSEKLLALDEVKGLGPKNVETLKKAGIKTANALDLKLEGHISTCGNALSSSSSREPEQFRPGQ